MSDYYGTYGQKVQYLSSDPPAPQTGQVWYNSTSATLKVRAVTTTGAWATSGNLNTARGVIASAGTATANLMTAMLTYETFTADQSFVGIGQTVANVDTNTLIYDSSQSYSIIESIKFINLQSSVVPIKAYWGDANGVPKAYLAYGLQVPPNSSIELLQGPKRINQNDRIHLQNLG